MDTLHEDVGAFLRVSSVAHEIFIGTEKCFVQA
jgi:hypothetical protein